jgi:hypothetical protein
MNQKIIARLAGFNLVVGLLFFSATPACQAGPIQLTTPVVFSLDGALSYNATTGLFHSETIPVVISDPNLPGGFGSFIGANDRTTIDLFVDHNGNFVSSGTGFTMVGVVDLKNDGTAVASGVLLFGVITAFQADPAGPPTRVFDGLFTIQGGALTQDVALSGGGTVFGGFPLGSTGGFFLFAENVATGILADFTFEFATPPLSVKDNVGVVVVPEPSTWVLCLVAGVGLAACGFFRRRAVRFG